MIDWKYLKREVRIFIAALLFALVLVGILLFLNQQTAAQWHKANLQLRQAESRLQTASNQKTILELYKQRFQALKNRNIFGDEQRLDWVETIQAASKRHAIPSVKFNLEHRGIANLPADVTDLTVFASTMHLELKLLHEGDLYNLLADLDQNAQGLYTVNECALRYTSSSRANNVFSSSLEGTCLLNWYTFSEVVEQQYDESGNPIEPDADMAGGGE